MFYEKYEREYEKKATGNYPNKPERTESDDFVSYSMVFTIIPASIISFYMNGVESIPDLIFNAFFIWIGLDLLLSAVHCIVKSATEPLLKTMFGHIMPLSLMKFASFVIPLIITILSSCLLVFACNKYETSSVEDVGDYGKTVVLDLRVEKDGDLTYIMDDEEYYDITSYIKIDDCNGSHMMLPGEPLTVTIPFTITVTNAMRYGEEMQTYMDSETVYDVFDAKETEFYVTYTFNPLVYAYDNNPPHNEPLDIVFNYTFLGEVADPPTGS